jgi:hypothetical protein
MMTNQLSATRIMPADLFSNKEESTPHCRIFFLTYDTYLVNNEDFKDGTNISGVMYQQPIYLKIII